MERVRAVVESGNGVQSWVVEGRARDYLLKGGADVVSQRRSLLFERSKLFAGFQNLLVTCVELQSLCVGAQYGESLLQQDVIWYSCGLGTSMPEENRNHPTTTYVSSRVLDSRTPGLGIFQPTMLEEAKYLGMEGS